MGNANENPDGFLGDYGLEPEGHNLSELPDGTHEAILSPEHDDSEVQPKKKNRMPLLIFAVFFVGIVGFVGYKLFGLVRGHSAQQAPSAGIQFPVSGKPGVVDKAFQPNAGLMPGGPNASASMPTQSLLGGPSPSVTPALAPRAATSQAVAPALPAADSSRPVAMSAPPAASVPAMPGQSGAPSPQPTLPEAPVAAGTMAGVSVPAATGASTSGDDAGVVSKVDALQRRVDALQSEVNRLAHERQAAWHRPARRIEPVHRAPLHDKAKDVRAADKAAVPAPDAQHMIFQGYSVRAVYPLSGDKAQAWVESSHGKLSVVGKGSIIDGATVLNIDPTTVEVMTSKGLIMPSGSGLR